MSRPLNVLSVFDGMSCAQIALIESGFTIGKYYASELDKFAIQQTQHNFPDTIQLGDVCKIKAEDLEEIDLFIGGSPCQGFSFAGKQLNFKDPRSALFFEFHRLWTEVAKINPDAVFILENVRMKQEYSQVISDYMGVKPVNINSNLVSAQNRNRFYWSNIKTRTEGLFNEVWTDVEQPLDKGILLRNVLQPESEIENKYYLSNKMIDWLVKHEKKSIEKGNGFRLRTQENDKATTLSVSQVKQSLSSSYVCVAMRGRNPDNPNDRSKGAPTQQRLEPNREGKTNCLTTVAKDNLIMQLNPSKESNGNQPYQQNRIYDIKGQAPALTAGVGGRTNIKVPEELDGFKLRRLTVVECSRLQTVPEWYKWIVSDTQAYKMLGNGFTVRVIQHILETNQKKAPSK